MLGLAADEWDLGPHLDQTFVSLSQSLVLKLLSMSEVCEFRGAP